MDETDFSRVFAEESEARKANGEQACAKGQARFLDALNEDTLATEFAERHKDQLRYCHHHGRWFIWTGSRWQKQETHLAFHWAREVVRDYNTRGHDKLAKTSTAGGVERYCQADPVFAVTSETWDQDPFLLGTPEGAVDLTTGNIRPPRQSDFITKATAVAPAPVGSRPELWLRFLREATADDEGLTRFLQQMVGYALTGDCRAHALFFVYGPGGNGKSVFLNLISWLLGDYAAVAGMETFVSSSSDRHPTDLAMLRGARLVTAQETEEGRKWAQSRIKALTGGDPITARFMRRDFFTFQPQFKLVFVGNHMPSLSSVGEAERRRFNIIPFTHQPKTPDFELPEKLKAEGPAILRWCIEGAQDWLTNGLVRPDIVAEATASYFDEQDLFRHWLDERCELVPLNRYAATAELFRNWKQFAEAAGEAPGAQKAFGEKMGGAGFVSSRKRGARVWQGVELKFDPACSGIDHD